MATLTDTPTTQTGILADLDATDVADLTAAFDEMRQARYEHPAEFVTACRRFQRLCRVLKVPSMDFERIALWANRRTFTEAVAMIEFTEPARIAA